MHVKTYPDAAALLADAQGSLEREEEKNTVVLSILLRLASGSKIANAPPYFATVRDGSHLVLVAAMTPPRPLLLSTTSDEWDAGVEKLAGSILHSGVHLKGVIACCPVVAVFASRWERLANVTSRVHMKEREYVLHEVLFAGSASGYLKPATAEEFDLVLKWGLSFHSEVRMPQETAEVEAGIRNKIDKGDVCLWVDKGEPVAMAGVNGLTRRGARIGLVYTPPELRGRGYATACVAHLSQRLLNSGREFCALSTDLANPVSNHIYQKIGYRPVVDFDQYEFKATPTARVPL